MTATQKKVRCGRCNRPSTRRELTRRKISNLLVCKKCNRIPEQGFCVKCSKQFPADQLEKNDDGQILCPDHLDEPREKQDKDLFGWFVLAVEPGCEGRVKKDILRKLRIQDKKSLMKRIIIPKKFEEMVVNKKGVKVAEGQDSNRAECFRQATAAIDKLEAEGSTLQYAYSTFRSEGIEKGREGNDWTWVVKTVPPEKERRTLQVKKFPGYLICQMEYCADLNRVVEITRGAWDFLLKPVVVGHLIAVKYFKRKGGFMWKVLTPDKKTVVAKGGPFREKGVARNHAETAKAKIEEFRPTPMKTREAAEILIAQKTVNAIARNPEERDKAIINYRVGSTVKVIHGTYQGLESKIEKIDREDKVNVKVWLNVPVLGHPIPVEFEYWQVETLSY